MNHDRKRKKQITHNTMSVTFCHNNMPFSPLALQTPLQGPHNQQFRNSLRFLLLGPTLKPQPCLARQQGCRRHRTRMRIGVHPSQPVTAARQRCRLPGGGHCRRRGCEGGGHALLEGNHLEQLRRSLEREWAPTKLTGGESFLQGGVAGRREERREQYDDDGGLRSKHRI